MLRPTMDQIESVVAVVNHGSTVEAARVLGRSQSQVSAHTTEFENSIGKRLFQRRNGRMFLREDVEQIVSAAEATLKAHRNLCALSEQTEQGGAFRIAAPRSLSMAILPRVIAKLSKRFPQTKFTALFMSYESILESVATGKADVGVAKLPILDKRVSLRPLFDSPSVVVMKEDDPLTKKQSLGPLDLNGRSLVRLGSGMTYWEKIELAFANNGLSPKFDFEVGGVGPACRLAAEGVGVAIVNELLASEYLDLLGLEARLFEPQVLHEFVLLERSFGLTPQVGREFASMIESEIRERTRR